MATAPPTSEPDHDPSAPEGSDSPAAPRVPPSRRWSAAQLAVATAIALMAAVAVALVLLQRWSDDPVDVRDALELDSGADAPVPSATIGDPAPTVELELLGGGTATFSDFGGTPVVVNFWSSTCAPCLAEMPAFETVAQRLDGEVAFLGIDVVDTVQAGEEMVERTGVSYPNARDPKGELLAAFGGTSLPRTVLLNEDGTVVATHTGAFDETELTAFLEEHGAIAA